VTTPVFNPGDVLGGRFQILVPLASGGMGQGFEAEDLHLKRRVALKVFLHPADQDEPAVERFVRDAREATQLESEHLAKVLDVGRLDFGAPYLAMELLEGKNLQALVAERGAFAVRDAVDYVMEACEALDEAHRAGLAHRDLKPANFLYCRKITGETTIKLLDFGILQRPSNPPFNMSPEQLAASTELDHRTDIWSLGTVLFELVTGQPVWRATSPSELVLQITSDPPPSMQDIEPSIPDGFAVIVNRCLEKDPARRYQRIAELAEALAPFGGDRAKVSLARLGRPAAAVAAPPLAPTAVARGAPAPRAARRSVPAATLDGPAPARHGRVGLALFVLTAIALGAAAAHRMAREAPSPEVATASASISPPPIPEPIAPPVRSAPLDAPEAAPTVQPSTAPSVTRKPQKATRPRLTSRTKPDCECGPGSPQIAPKPEPSPVTDDPFASRK
jgi:tRNA A-37 threonylcarbamoyl transferase component Bud32